MRGEREIGEGGGAGGVGVGRGMIGKMKKRTKVMKKKRLL
jgi:hypothetical protein